MPGSKSTNEHPSTAESILYFDGSMWVCVLERTENGRMQACRVVFGAEPSDEEALTYLLTHYSSLHFSRWIKADGRETDTRDSRYHINPKRLKRLAARELNRSPVSTKSQKALTQHRAATKASRKKRHRDQRDRHDAYVRAVKARKRHDKHRGH